MTSHPNRGWRSRWTVDLAGREARHGPTGLVVRFDAHPEGGWAGHAPNAQEIADAMRAAGTQHIERAFARLLREAGDLYMERVRDAES